MLCNHSFVEKCGVVHMHQNKKVVGGSKAEDHMSRCAVQDVYELHQNSQAPAALCEPMSEVCKQLTMCCTKCARISPELTSTYCIV